MNTLPRLNLHSNGRDFYFTENEELLDYIKAEYPEFKISSTLSLSQWDNVKNSHDINFFYKLTPNLNANDINFQNALIEHLLNYLTRVDEARKVGNHTSVSCVFMSIDTAVHTHPILLTTGVQANLRAVFIPK